MTQEAADMPVQHFYFTGHGATTPYRRWPYSIHCCYVLADTFTTDAVLPSLILRAARLHTQSSDPEPSQRTTPSSSRITCFASNFHDPYFILKHSLKELRGCLCNRDGALALPVEQEEQGNSVRFTLHACTTGWYAAITLTASIPTSTETPFRSFS
jgi:hypothetical protein